MKKRLLSLLLALVMIAGMIPAAALAVSAADGDEVAAMVDEMSLEDKITQMLMVDFRKWGVANGSATDFTVMNDEVRQILADYRFGAVILFANNVKDTEQSLNLAQDLQAAAMAGGGLPMMLAVDQEGGNVYRLGSGTALPGNMALGATYAANGTRYAEAAGEIIGSELGGLGLNTNLAPVVDVNNNANNPVIGLRSYSDDPVMVGELAAAQIEGMTRYGVIGCAKHFPGHGDTAVDSHYGLPMVDKPLSVLQENELKPYEVAISKGIDMIMTAHILYPQLESDTIVSDLTGEAESLPATMSDDILTGLLKEDMGFEGIIVTDAMNMAGITGCWDPVQACVIAIQAGVDMICMPTQLYCLNDLVNLDGIIAGIEAAITSGEIPMSRIDDAVTRILTVKKNRGVLDYDPANYSLEEAMAVVGCDDNRAMEREIAAAAVTVVKNENNVLPLEVTENSKVLMLVAYNNESAQTLMGWNRAKEAGIVPEGAEVDYFRFNSTAISTTLQQKLDWADTYIIVSEVSSTARMEYKHWLSSMPNTLCDYAAANGKTAIIASVDKPYDVQMYPNADAIVAVYGCKGSSVDPTEAIIGGVTGSELAYGPNIIAAVEVILGTFGAQGKLPVNVPVYDRAANEYTAQIAYPRGHGLTYAAREPAVDIPATIERIEVAPVTKMEEVDGYWLDIWGEPHSEQVEDAYFHYYTDPEYLSVYYSDGSVISGTVGQVEKQLDSYLSSKDDQSSANAWGVGTHTATAKFMGFTCEYQVVIQENPVERIEVDALILQEGVDGTSEGYEHPGTGSWIEDAWFHYDVTPVRMTVYYKDGTTLTGSPEEIKAQTGYDVIWKASQSYYDQWTLGTYTATAKFMGRSCVYQVTIVPAEPVYTVTYTNASISLAGDIGVNYYAALSEDLAADEGAYMQFTVAGQTQTVPVSEAEVGADGTYRFSCKVAAKQMTDEITGQMYLSDGTAVGEAKVYSVKAYCDAAIGAYEGNETYAALVDLMKAMLNYGGYSQVQLGYNTDKLANAGMDTTLPAPAAEELESYAHGAVDEDDGIGVASVSLLLESTTTIRFYFQLDGTKSIDEYTFYVDGVETAPVQGAENQYYVDKVGVAAKDLDEMVTVTVGGLTARYCGLSYVRQLTVLYPTYYPASLINVAKALCAYNQAANVYFA